MRRPALRTRSISPAARRSPIHQRIRLTRSSTCWTDPAGPEPRAGSALAPTLPSTLSLSLTGRRRSRASSTRSRRRRASVPRKYAETSEDGGQSYRQILVQEYNFSPGGATYQREEQRFNLRQVTHLRLTIVPNKSGSGTATLTALRLFALEARASSLSSLVAGRSKRSRIKATTD
jgi:hypothetical protein